MPNPVGARHHPLTATSTSRDRPLPAILSEAYFSFCLFTSLPPSFFSPFCPPSFSSHPRNPTERQHIKTGGGGRRWRREEDLRNADIAFPRLSGPLPFGASVFSPRASRRLLRDGHLRESSTPTFLSPTCIIMLLIRCSIFTIFVSLKRRIADKYIIYFLNCSFDYNEMRHMH